MADFDPPFAGGGERRVPTSSETQNGIPCGPPDIALFNWLFWSLQSEIGEVINYAGLDASNTSMTQLREAILALLQNQNDALATSVQTQVDTLTATVQALADAVAAIDTGGDPIVVPPIEIPTIDTSAFITLPQARSRLPFFPEATTASKTFGVTAVSPGTVRLPGVKGWLHRGIYPLVTTQTDFATTASKTYHLRWDSVDGWGLHDLSSAGYNPTSLPETDPSFDTTFDDMLVARIITNSSNVATITNLINSNRLADRKVIDDNLDNNLNWTALANSGIALNWARTPALAEPIMQTIKHQQDDVNGVPAATAGAGSLKLMAIRKTTTSRYGCGNVEYAYNDTTNNYGHLTFAWVCAAF